MADRADLFSVERSAVRAAQQDGLTEIVVGVFLFIVAVATGRPAFYWMYLAGIVVLGRGLQWLKARFAYERVGFAELPDEDPSKLRRGVLSWVLGVLCVAVAALAISGDLADNLAWRQSSPAIAGFLFMGGFLYLARRSGLMRQYMYAAVSPALGMLLAARSFDEPYEGVRVWALVMALLLLSVGGLVLLRFLRNNPIIDARGPSDTVETPPAGGNGDESAGPGGRTNDRPARA
jgi:hypothetical protein